MILNFSTFNRKHTYDSVPLLALCKVLASRWKKEDQRYSVLLKCGLSGFIPGIGGGGKISNTEPEIVSEYY